MIVDGEQEFRTKYKNFIDVLKSGMINMRVTETGKTYKFYYQSCPAWYENTAQEHRTSLAANVDYQVQRAQAGILTALEHYLNGIGNIRQIREPTGNGMSG